MTLRCWLARRHLVAWIDGELPPDPARRIEQHVVGCADCRALATQLSAAIDRQRLLLQSVREPATVDLDAAWATLWRAAADPPAAPRPPLWQPVFAGALAGALGVLLAALVSGRPRTVLVPLGIEAPPHPVAQQPQLYRDYPILEQLDALEHFDTVESVPLDDHASDSG